MTPREKLLKNLKRAITRARTADVLPRNKVENNLVEVICRMAGMNNRHFYCMEVDIPTVVKIISEDYKVDAKDTFKTTMCLPNGVIGHHAVTEYFHEGESNYAILIHIYK